MTSQDSQNAEEGFQIQPADPSLRVTRDGSFFTEDMFGHADMNFDFNSFDPDQDMSFLDGLTPSELLGDVEFSSTEDQEASTPWYQPDFGPEHASEAEVQVLNPDNPLTSFMQLGADASMQVADTFMKEPAMSEEFFKRSFIPESQKTRQLNVFNAGTLAEDSGIVIRDSQKTAQTSTLGQSALRQALWEDEDDNGFESQDEYRASDRDYLESAPTPSTPRKPRRTNAPLFRPVNDAARKQGRPQASSLFQELGLDVHEFAKLLSGARTFMLDLNHPQRRDCIAKRGAKGKNQVRLKLLALAKVFLQDEGWGKILFDKNNSKGYLWPNDERLIVNLVIPILRRTVVNERQRLYQLGYRDVGSAPSMRGRPQSSSALQGSISPFNNAFSANDQTESQFAGAVHSGTPSLLQSRNGSTSPSDLTINPSPLEDIFGASGQAESRNGSTVHSRPPSFCPLGFLSPPNRSISFVDPTSVDVVRKTVSRDPTPVNTPGKTISRDSTPIRTPKKSVPSASKDGTVAQVDRNGIPIFVLALPGRPVISRKSTFPSRLAAGYQRRAVLKSTIHIHLFFENKRIRNKAVLVGNNTLTFDQVMEQINNQIDKVRGAKFKSLQVAGPWGLSDVKDELEWVAVVGGIDSTEWMDRLINCVVEVQDEDAMDRVAQDHAAQAQLAQTQAAQSPIIQSSITQFYIAPESQASQAHITQDHVTQGQVPPYHVGNDEQLSDPDGLMIVDN